MREEKQETKRGSGEARKSENEGGRWGGREGGKEGGPDVSGSRMWGALISIAGTALAPTLSSVIRGKGQSQNVGLGGSLEGLEPVGTCESNPAIVSVSVPHCPYLESSTVYPGLF